MQARRVTNDPLEGVGLRDIAPPAAPSTAPGTRGWTLMIGSLMGLWAVGGTVFLLLLAVTSQPESAEASLRGIAVLGFAILAIIYVGRARLPYWTPDICAYILYTFVGWIVVVHRDPTSSFSFVYLWLVVHAFYFLHWKRAAPQLAYIGINYAVALWVLPGTFPTLRWTTTILSAVVICSMVALLRNNLHQLVAKLEGMATTDPLTGLANRRAYEDRVRQEISRARRSGEPLTAVMGDLDHFKQINDRMGHQEGDYVLKRAADILRRSARRVDAVVRLGGEEFVVLLPGTTAMSGYVVAERMRHLLREEFGADEHPVTMSFGVASYPDDANDADSLLAAADAALLQAKRAGRDRTIRFGQPLDIPT